MTVPNSSCLGQEVQLTTSDTYNVTPNPAAPDPNRAAIRDQDRPPLRPRVELPIGRVGHARAHPRGDFHLGKRGGGSG